MTDPFAPRQVEIDDFSLRRARRGSLIEVGMLYLASVTVALALAAMLVVASGGSWWPSERS
jgi:hypothetical protein